MILSLLAILTSILFSISFIALSVAVVRSGSFGCAFAFTRVSLTTFSAALPNLLTEFMFLILTVDLPASLTALAVTLADNPTALAAFIGAITQ